MNRRDKISRALVCAVGALSLCFFSGAALTPALAQFGMPHGPKQQTGPTYQASGDNFQVCYATTRLSDNSSGQSTYGGQRNLDYGQGSIEYGTATFARPAGYQTISAVGGWDELRDQMTASDNYFAAAPIKRLNRESPGNFFNRVRNFHGLIVVYVHGYDESFDNAVRELAELANEYQARSPGTQILPIVFSWPSLDNTAAYSSDEASLEWSEKPFRDMINQIVQTKSSDAALDFVAHSMGSRYAFSLAASLEGSTNQPPFRNIFLSCSDVDFHTAESRRDSVQNCVNKMLYIFVNDNDGALLTSQVLHKAPRLGRPVDPGNNSGLSTGISPELAGQSQPPQPGGLSGLLGASPSNLLNQAENMLSDKAVSMFGQKARTLVDQLTTGNRPTFTKSGQMSAEQSVEVSRWLSRDPNLSREWGNKSRLIDDTGFVTLNMGHSLVWPLMAGLMLDQPQDAPFTFATMHKSPDSAMLKQMGGTPTYLYRFDRLDLSRLSR